MLRRARELNFFRKQNECKLKAWGGSYAALPPDGGSSYSAICTRRVVGTKLCLGLPGEKVPPGLGRGCTKQSWTRAHTVALTVAHCPNKQKKKAGIKAVWWAVLFWKAGKSIYSLCQAVLVKLMTIRLYGASLVPSPGFIPFKLQKILNKCLSSSNLGPKVVLLCCVSPCSPSTVPPVLLLILKALPSLVLTGWAEVTKSSRHDFRVEVV